MQLVVNTMQDFPDWVPTKKGKHRLMRIVGNTIECKCTSQFRAYQNINHRQGDGDNPVVSWLKHIGVVR